MCICICIYKYIYIYICIYIYGRIGFAIPYQSVNGGRFFRSVVGGARVGEGGDGEA